MSLPCSSSSRRSRPAWWTPDSCSAGSPRPLCCRRRWRCPIRGWAPTKSLDVVTAASVLLVLASAGRVAWLAGAYATAIAATLALRALAIARLRRTGSGWPPGAGAGRRPPGRPDAIGPTIVAVSMAAVTAFWVARGEGAWLAAAALLLGLALLLSRQSPRAETKALGEAEGFELLGSSAIAVEDAHAQPGNVLVPVRNPHALAHVAAALQGAGDRDVVVMTVRLLGVDADDASPTIRRRRRRSATCFARVIALAERYGRPGAPADRAARHRLRRHRDAVVRLRSSEVYVGESATLSADDQARLLGEAWERAEQAGAARRPARHLPPQRPHRRLSPRRAPARAHARRSRSDSPPLARRRQGRRAARPPPRRRPGGADANGTTTERTRSATRRCAAIRAGGAARRRARRRACATRDFARLRDMVRNRHAERPRRRCSPSSALEDQVVVFRVLPRKDAAAVFEYLSHDAQEALLKAMAQEDVAALLNNMAPDDRTMFLEELPADGDAAAAGAAHAGGARRRASRCSAIPRTRSAG